MKSGSTSILNGDGELLKVALKFWQTTNFVLKATNNAKLRGLYAGKSGNILNMLILQRYKIVVKGAVLSSRSIIILILLRVIREFIFGLQTDVRKLPIPVPSSRNLQTISLTERKYIILKLQITLTEEKPVMVSADNLKRAVNNDEYCI